MSDGNQSRAVMITGATGGLGQNLARRLARERDFDQVVLAARNAERGTALRDALQAEFPGVRFVLSPLDVASLASVRAAAARLEEPLDALVLNAGGTGGPRPQARTPDGVSQMFAANVVGHAALVDLLVSAGLLRGTVEFVGSEAAFGVPALHLPAPVIADGSVAEFSSWIDGSWFDGRRYDRGLAHGQAKLLGALWAGALARARPELRTVTMSPGNTAGTGVLRDLPLPLRLLIPRVNAALGRSHSLDAGTGRLAAGLLDPAYGTGRFWASAPGKLTGPVVDQAAAHPIAEDLSFQDHAFAALRAIWLRDAVV
jgi:NAD(P)-dependent dehydrogenase (short-subunit alcohol dehydrogenase family)